jgi:hypothetical protein
MNIEEHPGFTRNMQEGTGVEHEARDAQNAHPESDANPEDVTASGLRWPPMDVIWFRSSTDLDLVQC